MTLSLHNVDRDIPICLLPKQLQLRKMELSFRDENKGRVVLPYELFNIPFLPLDLMLP